MSLCFSHVYMDLQFFFSVCPALALQQEAVIVRSLLPNCQEGQADWVFGARHTTRRSLPDTRHAGWRGQSVAVMDDHLSLFVICFLEFGVWNFGASDNGF
jgi:hypothetical protein